MTHEELWLIDAFLDDELDPEARAAVDAHLEGCSRCRATLEEGRAVRSALAECAPLPALAGVDALWIAIEPQLAPRRHGIGVAGWSTGVLMGIAILVTQASAIQLLGLGVMRALGAPIDAWLAAVMSSGSLLSLPGIGGERLLPSADTLDLALAGFTAWILVLALALSFFGWTLAERRRALLPAGAGVAPSVLGR